MLKRFSLLCLTPLLFLAAPSSQAADGQICYSSFLTSNTAAGFGTTVYPQLTNDTKFSCKSGVQLTLGQLVARGWKISSLMPMAFSQTINSNGTGSSSTRFMLVITI
ncbi:MAG: hypothetical protein ACN6O2_05060 [Stenotrophomonas sp.]